MSEQERKTAELKTNIIKPAIREEEQQQNRQNLPAMLKRLGNRNVQRILQRTGNGSQQLDDETGKRINNERGGGAPLESRLQMQMSKQMGFDLSGVRVHTSPSSDQLNQQLNARAFTTGQDIFFRSGEYDPASSGGKELLAHELTHVVQQGTGQVQNPGGITVNAPGDQYEQEADRVAAGMMSNTAANLSQAGAVAQRNGLKEEDETAQTKSVGEHGKQLEEDLDELTGSPSSKAASPQRQEDEDEKVQMKPDRQQPDQVMEP